MTDNLSPTGLLPCPFCGGEMIQAGTCFGHPANGCIFEDSYFGYEQVAAWNTRSLSASGDVERDATEICEVPFCAVFGCQSGAPNCTGNRALTASGNSGAVSDDLIGEILGAVVANIEAKQKGVLTVHDLAARNEIRALLRESGRD